MLSMQNKLQSIKNALVGVTSKTYHYTAPTKAQLPYIVWYEESEETSVEVNNHKQEQAISGYVEFFTKTEFDGKVDQIQNALNGVDGLSWSYENVVYGDPATSTDVIHHTWGWSIG